MPEEYLIEHCAPTLAGIKTGNLFSIKKEADIYKQISELNRKLRDKGIRVIPIPKRGGGMLIYLYRPEHLKRDLESPDAREILEGRGYSGRDSQKCIVELIRHLSTDTDFPHEIGLFLGYPPADVKGFMESPHTGYKCVGTWKVYGDIEQAEKLFAAYRKCRYLYDREYKKGRSLEQLAVNTRGRCFGASNR